jgi:DNA-binding NtrC family response regulator
MPKDVLLVDDNPVQLAARQQVLKSAGLDVHIATRAESALALLKSETFRSQLGLILTDHVMPEVSGAEFVKKLREHAPHLPILVISGMAEAEQDYAEFANLEFRQKPVPPQELIALVQSKLKS